MQQKPNLADMMGYLVAVIASDPPIDQGLGANMMNTGTGFFPP